jgi:O-antigen/teichoic acid export membrane protein
LISDPPVLRNGLYNVSGQAARGVVALLTIPVLVRCLGIGEYGVWSLAYALLSLLLIGEAGISITAAVFLSRDLGEPSAYEANCTLTFLLVGGVVTSIAIGILVWFSAPILAGSIHAFSSADRLEVRRALQVAGFAVAAFIFERVLVGIEQAFDLYGTINALDLVQSILANVGLMAVAWAGGRSIAMMEWQVFAWFSLLIVHCCLVVRIVANRGFRPQWNGTKAKRMFKFTAATWSSVCGSAAFSQCDRLIVGGILGAPILGIYSAITNLTSRINSFSGMAVQPLLPSLSRQMGQGSGLRDETVVRQAVILNAVIAVIAGMFLFLLADVVMKVAVPGEASAYSILALEVAAVIYTLYSFNAPGYFMLFSFGAERKNAVVVLLSGAISLALIFVGARHFGLIGAVAGNVGYLGTLCLTAVGMRRMGVTLRKYATWVATPGSGFALVVGIGGLLQPDVLWRAVLVTMGTLIILLWFVRENNSLHIVNFRLRRASQLN